MRSLVVWAFFFAHFHKNMNLHLSRRIGDDDDDDVSTNCCASTSSSSLFFFLLFFLHQRKKKNKIGTHPFIQNNGKQTMSDNEGGADVDFNDDLFTCANVRLYIYIFIYIYLLRSIYFSFVSLFSFSPILLCVSFWYFPRPQKHL